MSKRIILPNQQLQQVGGSITYQIGKQGKELSLQVAATDQLQAEFVLLSGTMQFIARTIDNAQNAVPPEDAEEERKQFIDDLRATYVLLQGLHMEISKDLAENGFKPKFEKG